MKAVFTVNPSMDFPGVLGKSYHFPNKFLDIVKNTIGDMVVYHETRSGGGRAGYVAVATVSSVVPDEEKKGFSFAKIKGYKPFVNVVPFKDHPETAIGKMPKKKIAFFVQANPIRAISDADFRRIMLAGSK